MTGSVPQPDRDTLLAVARQVAGTPSAALGEWQITPIGGSATHVNAWRVSGSLLDGPRRRAFSVVLKRRDGAPETDTEAQAYQSGLLDRLRAQPFGLIAPRCFGVGQPSAGVVWLWLEDVSEPPGARWSIERYGLASYHLGRFNGAHPDDEVREFLEDPARAQQVPAYPWLGRGFLPDWLGFLEAEGIGDAIVGVRPEDRRAWEHPLVRRAFSPPTCERLRWVWHERDRLLAALNRLPRTLAHGDAHRRNLLTRAAPAAPLAPNALSGDLTVGVDWDTIGLAPLGEDAGHLVSSSQLMDVDPGRARALDRAVFEGYLQGLRDAGWRIDRRTRDLIRFGYALHAPLNMGVFAGGGLVSALSQPWLRQWLEELLGR
ncbi:MAG: hypothetical protein ACRDI2_16720, partial [Chloroflexota bacterium]